MRISFVTLDGSFRSVSLRLQEEELVFDRMIIKQRFVYSRLRIPSIDIFFRLLMRRMRSYRSHHSPNEGRPIRFLSLFPFASETSLNRDKPAGSDNYPSKRLVMIEQRMKFERDKNG